MYYCRLLAAILSLCWGGYGIYEQHKQNAQQRCRRGAGAACSRTYDLRPRMYHDSTL